MVVSYSVRVKLFLGAIGGDLTAELPFVLMHPRPNLRKIIKADTLASVGSFACSQDGEEGADESCEPVGMAGGDMELTKLTHRTAARRE